MNNSYKGHLVIVFALEHYNPLGHIRSLGENGINPIYISVKRRGPVACLSKYISTCHHVDSVEEGYKLLISEYGGYAQAYKPYVIFSDDKSIGFFDLHYDEIKDKFICFNAGKQGRINEFMDKQRILEIAKAHGFQVLDSWVVRLGEIPKGIEYPVITKDISPNSGNWKSDVFICENEEELKKAFANISSPIVQIQKYIDKKNEYAIEGFTINKGAQMLIGSTLKWKYLVKGYYSSYHDVTMLKDFRMRTMLNELFSEIGFEGIFEVEFLIDQDDTYYFLEVNFRASAWNYSSAVAGMPLAYLWVKSMEDGFIAEDAEKEFEDFTDMSEVIDYGKRVEGKMVSLAEWLRDFKEAKGTYYYNKNDMAPFEYLFEHWDEYK
ncbi:biotin carboxylase [Lachnospiraceae bacterium WCA-9-b2]|uniref:Biotin carboxylase n=1 Tax=Sporofaciens musculi TaxID=2681861 RepID=A0A7X3MHA3_9FIRM|nr:biotin carboxylase [Sporofaciens musculi]MXP76217.1 biotin carboxylase [Sporofaciens musculi]